MTQRSGRYVALTGGVGGAKLGLGLAHLLTPESVTFVVNTGDDFEHLGLHVSPDLDTLMYTLSGLNNPETGWGRAEESWNFIDALAALGGETWFRLGDRDLATHITRTGLMRDGMTLTEVTETLYTRLGIPQSVLPMSDAKIRTMIETRTGEMTFQHYFVREKCEPAVSGFRFAGTDNASCTPAVRAALTDPSLDGIIICPSNPYVSIDPILAVPGIRESLVNSCAPIIAVSPIVGGEALKGPTAKMMKELDVPSTALSVAAHYAALIDGFILDNTDAALAPQVGELGLETTVAQTVMVTLDDRIELAHTALDMLRRNKREQ